MSARRLHGCMPPLKRSDLADGGAHRSGDAAITREPRRGVELSGFAALQDGSTFPITVLDLSYDGCRVETPVVLLPKVKLKFSISRLGTLDAVVRWYANGHAGLRFSPDEPAAKLETPRKQQRHLVNAELSLRRRGGPHYRARVFDLTPAGCKVEFVERPRPEDPLWAKFDGLEAIEARVRWVEGMSGGIEFVRPIYPAVFELLLARLGTGRA